MNAFNELEEIKDSWKQLSKDRLKKDVSVSDLQKIIRNKSKGELTKIKRKLLIESTLSVLLLPFYLLFIHQINTKLAYAIDIFLVVLIAALTWPTVCLLRVGKLQDQETIVFLRKFVYQFKRAIKGIVVIIIAILPIFILTAVIGFIQGYKMSSGGQSFDLSMFSGFDNTTLILGIVSLTVLLIISGLLFLLKLYYMFMFGKHVKNLKNFLAELEQQELADSELKKPDSI